MKFEAVIFDLDGTLADTLEDLADSCNAVLQEMGFPRHPVESYRMFVGEGAMKLMKNMLPADRRSDEMILSARAGFDRHYLQRYLNKTKPYDGIPEMIAALKSGGVKLAVLSNKPDAFTQKIVAKLFGENVFDIVIGQREGMPRKPDPTGALYIVKQLDADKAKVLYVGDSGVDMKTAKAAGLYCVGALWGFRSREEICAAEADAVISKPNEILKIVGLES